MASQKTTERVALGKKLREYRKKIGYSQWQLADALKVSQAKISKTERGFYGVNLEFLEALVKFTKKSPTWWTKEVF